MKKNLIVLVVLALWLAACGGSAAPDGELTAELDPEEEWRIVYTQTVMLEATCGMLYQTDFDYNHGTITLERLRTELEAEAGFIQASQEELTVLEAPSEAVAPYLTELESAISGMQTVLADGEAAVIEDDYDLWNGVYLTCDTLYYLQEEVLAAAAEAGLTQAMLDEFESDAGEAVLAVYESTEWGRTAADAPAATNTAAVSTPTQSSVGSTGDQESLKKIWRPAYNMGALSFETCVLVYQTYYDFGDGIIGVDRAQAELEAESRSIASVLTGIATTPPESEEVAAFLLQIEAQASALTDFLGPQYDQLGTPQALDTIGRTCEYLQNIMNSIFSQAQAAGLSRDSLDELDEGLRPVIDDLYDQTWYGR